ncbi:MAG: class C sortase [Lachnospiraceae bacterium]
MKRILAIIFVVMGVGLFCYPDVATCCQNMHITRYVEKFEKENIETTTGGDVRYEASLTYNRKIYEEKQSSFRDAWTYTQNPIVLDGFEDQQFGYIKIPAMNLMLPLYIGASDKNMENGAAVLGGTSMPIGGINTNSVIAGHRGYKGMPYFKEIEKLQTGDRLFIRNPWETLVYIVESIKIIDAYDADSVKIQKGKDMITLITCHPYRSHGKYRYLVYCARDEGQEMKDIGIAGEVPFQSSEEEIRTEKRFRFFCGICILFFSIFTLMKKR